MLPLYGAGPPTTHCARNGPAVGACFSPQGRQSAERPLGSVIVVSGRRPSGPKGVAWPGGTWSAPETIAVRQGWPPAPDPASHVFGAEACPGRGAFSEAGASIRFSAGAIVSKLQSAALC